MWRWMLILLLLAACQPSPPQNDSGLTFATPAPDATFNITASPSITPAPLCDLQEAARIQDLLPEYIPTQGEFIQIQDNGFMLNGEPFPVYGINYYPRDYPYERFLVEMQVASVEFEFNLMRDAGINMLRIFLRHADLFTCNGTVPRLDRFARLDEFIYAAATNGFKLILVLNADDTLPYGNSHSQYQVSTLAQRYANEPGVFAYDLRQDGDIDALNSRTLTPQDVLSWLSEMAAIVHVAAPYQFVTAGWQNNADQTADIVDFVSFQSFDAVESIRQEIAILTAATDKPILLASVGYSTFDYDELGQRQAYFRAFEAVEQNNLAGWVVWTGFDYPLPKLCPIEQPDCVIEPSSETRFGLWNTSYFPKRALDAVRLATGMDTSS